MNIILSGMPASGKTTVSKKLSELSGFEILDTDAEIVKKYGVISDIFKTHGEEYFRKLESEQVKIAAAMTDKIIATGGGCLLREENVVEFKKSGKIVYLKASIETLLNRLEGDTTRPLLYGDKEGNLRRLFRERAAIYEGSADFSVETDGLTPTQIAEKILELMK